ncbi:DUF3096 domain-containing protein [Thiorhodococcus mannitoliphagus]|uniref:DUF3096 domain-containing protein n=1 Tax=Thiorhodococcus mannitoliphagus TaxID=329406 RepID=A0A6P1DW14_9GAMM|nr:DUF3096 domain-containing protein [Thiorhodococcus mannitoliphagus]
MDIPQMLQHWPMEAVVAIVAGLVILLVPRILNYAIAAYLLLIGALGLLQFFYGQAIRPMPIISLVAGVVVLIKPAILNYVVGIYLILLGLREAGILRF